MTAVTVPPPRNEPVRTYAPGSAERAALAAAVASTAAGGRRPLPQRIAGRDHRGGGEAFEVRSPHDHAVVLGEGRLATADDVRAAVDAALAAAPAWSETTLAERAAVFLRAADLLAGPWRDRINAATILGQSKSVHQAEIDAACELVDFWRFNPHFAERLVAEQPLSPPGAWNHLEPRPLEGFVVAITPFNFTAIAGNLPTAPALMGNTVVWKPSTTAQLASSVIMEVLEAAGLPAGVINMVTGHGHVVDEVALGHPAFAGLHFTGSTAAFHHLWRRVADNIDRYRSYPRLVGETGGKDFVVAHESADPDALLVGLLRGAFEYQGQKCSAASRAYVPAEMWSRLRGPLAEATGQITMGDVGDLSTFMGAVIDERAFRRHEEVLSAARSDPGLRLVAGGECDASRGWFVRPTIYETDDPRHPLMERELFGPILCVHPYRGGFDEALELVDTTSPYALTGAVFATDRDAVRRASRRLRHAAGNFYVNDKPTGAVVGQQPFGGGRASGTNDKAGSGVNLMRWVSLRTVKETLLPPGDWRYPHMG